MRSRASKTKVRGVGYTPLMVIGVLALLVLAIILYMMLNRLEEMESNKESGTPGHQRPNIVLISIDSLRADHLSCYGYEKNTSPAIDRLAREGVLFKNVYSTTSWTLPSHISMMTGLPDQAHQVTTHTRSLADGWPTLAQELKKQGYATGGFFTGPYLHPIFGFGRGFDRYESCIRTDTVFDGYMDEKRTMLDPEHRKIWNDKMNGILGDSSSPTVLKKSKKWLNEIDLEKPFFMFLHFFDVHYDYLPPKECDIFYPDYKGEITGHNYEDASIYHKNMKPDDLKRVISLYDGEILWVDKHVQMIMDFLEEKGVKENTVVVVTSDHGEEFFEHGEKDHRKVNGLFNEVIKVPLVFHWPKKIAQGRTVMGQYRIIDIMPTLLEIAGNSKMEIGTGKSLCQLLRKDRGGKLLKGEDNVAISELTFLTPKVVAAVDRADTKDRIISMRSKGWHLTYFADSGKAYLFDMEADPNETRNLAEERKEDVDRWLKALKRQDAALIKLGSTVKRKGLKELDPELIKQLEALGYMGN